jgi:hypothetical protein
VLRGKEAWRLPRPGGREDKKVEVSERNVQMRSYTSMDKRKYGRKRSRERNSEQKICWQLNGNTGQHCPICEINGPLLHLDVTISHAQYKAQISVI